jgi:hypothetical protein
MKIRFRPGACPGTLWVGRGQAPGVRLHHWDA